MENQLSPTGKIESYTETPEFRLAVQKLIANRTKLADERHQFALKHNFLGKRSQNFKNCIVIRWKTSRKNHEINYSRLDEFVRISHELSDKYDLWGEDQLLESELRLVRAGIYVFSAWDYQAWAIPNENKEIQDYVLSKLPKWAKVSVKK